MAEQGLHSFFVQGLHFLVAQGFFIAQGFFEAQGFFFMAQGLQPALQPALQCCPALHLFLQGEHGAHAATAMPPAPIIVVINTADHSPVRLRSHET
ncbi:hypothetical protein [Marinobacter sp. KMM 10035]|uniref:hypothetical protein n=1 Tax=Marinobacter sp. KMM 10035 TaxID=3134034 RepID=UPI00397D71A0